MYHVRDRVLHKELGYWAQRDRIGYLDGANLYEYCRSSPISYTDPFGQDIFDAIDRMFCHRPHTPPSGAVDSDFCNWALYLSPCWECCTTAQVETGEKCCNDKEEALVGCSFDRDGKMNNYKCKKTRRCRCSIRHMPDPERKRHNCPGHVFGEGETRGECQKNAKLTAPKACRAFYGHCDWVK